MSQSVTVGRIVHFIVGPSSEHRPAIVVRVVNAAMGKVDLQVFGDDRRDVRCGVHFTEDVVPGESVGTWHWPEREGA
jgi:hypothetical protein